MGVDTEPAAVVSKKTKNPARSKLKNILCRPDRELWPALTEERSKVLVHLISKYQVDVPMDKRPPWAELKLIPKNERPKSKRPGCIPGLVVGIAQVARLLKSGKCTGVILDSGVHPRILVSHIIAAALRSEVPVVCMAGLKSVTASRFGFSSCCLALEKCDLHEVLRLKISEYFIDGKWKFTNCDPTLNESSVVNMDVTESKNVSKFTVEPEMNFTYLKRTSKEHRVFVPPTSTGTTREAFKDFSGQNFIGFTKTNDPVSKEKHSYKGMIVKRISSNPNRKKNKTKIKK